MKKDYLEFERAFLSPYATLSENTKGRLHPIEPCDMRTEFQRDRDRVIHCKSFRRLKHKTQVFLSPDDDHFRTRLTHTLEVTQISRTISRALRLNEDLTEAIALAHDLGHTPFGHTGERVLNKKIGSFHHNEQSLRVIDILENDGKGLNLTFEVRDGVLNHRTECTPCTMEGAVVRISDKIAYLNHDVDDAIRAGYMTESSLPKSVASLLGIGRGKMINSIVGDILKESYGKPYIAQSAEYSGAMDELRKYMFKNIYRPDTPAKKGEESAERLVATLFDYFYKNRELVPESFKRNTNDANVYIADYIAGMTDNYAVKIFKEIFIP